MQYVLEFDITCRRYNIKITENWLDHVEFCLQNSDPRVYLAGCPWCSR